MAATIASAIVLSSTLGLHDSTAANILRVAPLNPQHQLGNVFCCPSFALEEEEDRTASIRRQAVDGIASAFILDGVLSCSECAAIVAIADRMGFERPEDEQNNERRNGAVSWVLHNSLCAALGQRASLGVPRPRAPEDARSAALLDPPLCEHID